MVTRAISIELGQDMSAEQFLLALRRHMALRSVPKHIFSDQAPQHLLMDKVFQDIFQNVTQDPNVKTYIAEKGIEWHFTPAYSPWSRGMVEIMVKSCKQALLRTVGKLTLTRDQLHTILYEVSSMLNSRPITHIGPDIQSMDFLTPQDFMGLQFTGVPDIPTDLTDPDFLPKISNRQNLLEFWRKGNVLLDNIWKLWGQLYL